MRKEHIKLTEPGQSYLTTLATSGQLKARKFKRVITLLLLNQAKTMMEVSKLLAYAYPSIISLKQNFLQIVKERSEKQIKIDWQFSIEKARTKLNRHYEKVNSENSKYKET